MGAIAIALRNVSREFPNGDRTVAALRNLTLNVPRGSFVAVVGPSGSGKTTLLNVISGLEHATAGSVVVLDRDLRALSESARTALRARGIGLVFQEPHLLPGLTALENVIAAKLPWHRPGALAAAARAMLDAVGLAHRADFAPSQLSAGERQRVGIARALVGQPPIVIADEPTGNLDAAARDAILDLLEHLRAAFALTLIVATHDPAVAARADTIVTLADGALAD